ncbi:MAG: 50S ribosomal protein L11 methyltransferase [Bacteroidales bacterium]|nr:50S ribosomal protein L11 methyltransferase [Bacteroidales bacterium]
MKYAEVTIRLNPVEPFRDILIYYLGEEGPYDSFEETRDGLKAYVPMEQYDVAFLQSVVHDECVGCEVNLSMQEMPDRNWNEEWERQHQPVLVDDFCWVRAPFHPHRDDVQYEIEIEPKMSFGTAHHQTTYMMLSLLRDEAIEGKRVLDMGSGTAVLAILARMKGAAYVEAIDNDEWAYRNAQENVERNGCGDIVCLLGDASLLTADKHFDIIIANINRNILLRDMAAYAAVLADGGTLLLSGFYQNDVASLVEKASTLGLTLTDQRSRDGWQALRLVKTNPEQ